MGGHEPSVTDAGGTGGPHDQWAPSALTSPGSAPVGHPVRPLSQNPTSLLESPPELDSTDSAGRGALRNPLGEIQSPDLILRTSHHRKEAKIMTLSTFQTPFLSPVVALAGGWRLCSYFYPPISGIAD